MLIEELGRHAAFAAGLSARQRSVLEVAERFGANLAHARQVAALAQDLLARLAAAGESFPPEAHSLLTAAAGLHEVGQIVAQSAHHKHAAYLIRHAGLRGFTPRETELVAQLARYHRRSAPKASHPEYAALPPPTARSCRASPPCCAWPTAWTARTPGGAALGVAASGGRVDPGGGRRDPLDLVGAREKADLWAREFGPLSFQGLT